MAYVSFSVQFIFSLWSWLKLVLNKKLIISYALVVNYVLKIPRKTRGFLIDPFACMCACVIPFYFITKY